MLPIPAALAGDTALSNTVTRIDQPLPEHRLLGLFSAQANAARRAQSARRAVMASLGDRSAMSGARRILRREVAAT